MSCRLLMLVSLVWLGSASTQAQSVSCITVTRGQKTTCTATGGTHYKNWQFEGRGNLISRGATVDSSTWAGIAADDGGVAVDVTTASGVKTVYGSLSVLPRSPSAFMLAKAAPMQQAVGYTCISGTQQAVVLSLPSPPTNSGTGDNVLGKYCDIDSFGYTFNRVLDGGPNNGYRFSASVTSQTQYFWVESPDLVNTSSAFYKAQCGNYNATSNPSGYISGPLLAANTINHESGVKGSHYAEWLAALADPRQNPGGNLEQLALAGSDTQYQKFVADETAPNINTINSSTMTEPCMYGVSDDASCTFGGFVNFANGSGQYATCH